MWRPNRFSLGLLGSVALAIGLLFWRVRVDSGDSIGSCGSLVDKHWFKGRRDFCESQGAYQDRVMLITVILASGLVSFLYGWWTRRRQPSAGPPGEMPPSSRVGKSFGPSASIEWVAAAIPALAATPPGARRTRSRLLAH